MIKKQALKITRNSLLISTPRHTDHSDRVIVLSWSRSQYWSKVLAQAFGFTNFLIILFKGLTSLRRSLLSFLVSSSENFHSMTLFSGVSSNESDSDWIGKPISNTALLVIHAATVLYLQEP